MSKQHEKLRLHNLHKSYANQAILQGIDLSVLAGDFVCFLGPSGCGKSTLLRCIAGLEPIQQGHILMNGHDVTHTEPAARNLAMVFQSYALYPHMTVAKNMAFGLSLQGVAKAEIQQRVRQAAQTLQLDALLERKPRQLSGGQRQRVAIGRAIVRKPEIFLFDEPLSNLDAELRTHTRVELARLHQALGATMIYVTHDQVEAMTLANKVLIMNAGKLEQFGAPMELYHRPRNRFVAGFIGSPRMNFFKITAQTSAQGQGLQFRLAGKNRDCQSWSGKTLTQISGQELELGIRPEHIQIGALEQADLPAQVQFIERLGVETLLYLNSPAGKLSVRLNGNAEVSLGQNLGLHFPEHSMHLFDASGQALSKTTVSSYS